jgi:hypothetical protein
MFLGMIEVVIWLVTGSDDGKCLLTEALLYARTAGMASNDSLASKAGTPSWVDISNNLLEIRKL